MYPTWEISTDLDICFYLKGKCNHFALVLRLIATSSIWVVDIHNISSLLNEEPSFASQHHKELVNHRHGFSKGLDEAA